MASILIERLLGEPFVASELKIHSHAWFAANVEVAAGKITRNDVKAAYALDADSQIEYDAWAALAPGQTANLVLWLERMHSVIMLGEERFPGYETPALIRAKIGL